jgi:hypothetical protein
VSHTAKRLRSNIGSALAAYTHSTIAAGVSHARIFAGGRIPPT